MEERNSSSVNLSFVRAMVLSFYSLFWAYYQRGKKNRKTSVKLF